MCACSCEKCLPLTRRGGVTRDTAETGRREWTPHGLILAREWEYVINTEVMLSFLSEDYPALVEYESVLMVNVSPPPRPAAGAVPGTPPPPPPPLADRGSLRDFQYPSLTTAQVDRAVILPPGQCRRTAVFRWRCSRGCAALIRDGE